MIHLVVPSLIDARLELAQGQTGPRYELQQALDKMEALHVDHQNDLARLTCALESSGRKDAIIISQDATISELKGQVAYGQRTLDALGSENEDLQAQRQSISSALVLETLLWALNKSGLTMFVHMRSFISSRVLPSTPCVRRTRGRGQRRPSR